MPILQQRLCLGGLAVPFEHCILDCVDNKGIDPESEADSVPFPQATNHEPFAQRAMVIVVA